MFADCWSVSGKFIKCPGTARKEMFLFMRSLYYYLGNWPKSSLDSKAYYSLFLFLPKPGTIDISVRVFHNSRQMLLKSLAYIATERYANPISAF